MYSRYFADRYFPRRFWPNAGAEIAAVVMVAIDLIATAGLPVESYASALTTLRLVGSMSIDVESDASVG